MRYTLIGFIHRGMMEDDYGEKIPLKRVQTRQRVISDQPDILLGDDARYYLALEGNPPPDLIAFDTLEAAVAAAIILGY